MKNVFLVGLGSILAMGFYLFFAQSICAQQTTEVHITGTVFDPANAVVPNVQVTAVDSQTHLEGSATTGPDGTYTILSLLPGTYTVTAVMTGFKTFVDDSIVAYGGDTRRVDIHLQVGTTNETVNVSAQGSVIETSNATLSTDIPPIQYEYQAGLRGSGGRPLSATEFAPGVQNYATSGRVYINNGSNAVETRSQTDGMEGDNRGDFRPTLMSVAETKIVTVDAPAEYQLSGTAASITKGGTNDYHGQVLINVGNGALNSLGPCGSCKRGPGVPSHTWEFQVGGPVRIPKLYNGKNKTFFHFDYQPNRSLYAFPMTSWFNINGGPFPPWVTPYANMRQGDLSIFTTPIIDPTTGQPFPGNQIPSNRISQVSQQVMTAYWPLPNFGAPNNLTSNFIQQNARRPITLDNWNFRIDHQIYSHNNLSLIYYKFASVDSSNIFFSPVIPRAERDGAQTWNLIDTQIFTANIVNMFQISRNHTYDYNVFGNEEAAKVLTTLGLDEGVTPTPGIGGPMIEVVGFAHIRPFGNSADDWYYWTIKDHLTITKGNHLLTMGTDIKPLLPTFVSRQTAWGTFAFDGAITGNALADFLLGIPDTASLTQPRLPSQQRWGEIGFFFQDNYKVSKHITVNLGLRHQTYTVPTDALGLQYNFDVAKLSVVVPNHTLQSQINPSWPAAIPIISAAQAGYPNDLRHGNHHNFEPRLGFAYSPNEKTVIRVGFGVYHVPLSGAQQTEQDPLGPTSAGPFSPLNINLGPNQIVNGVPQFSFPTPFSGATGNGGLGTQSVFAVPPNLKTPYTEQWNLSAERDLGHGFSVQVAYVGSHGANWWYTRELEQPLPGLIPFSPSMRPIRPDLFNSIQTVGDDGTADYNALQLQLQRLYSSGLFFRTSFTWSKRLSDIPDSNNAFGPVVENSYDIKSYRGIQAGLVPLKWTANMVYPLPFGKGRRFLSQSEGLTQGVINAVLGQWVFSNVLFWQSGARFTPVFSGADPSNTGVVGGRTDVICNGNRRISNTQFFDKSCYPIPQPGHFGNAGIGSLQGPRSWDMDASLYKDFNFVPAWRDRGPVFRIEAHAINWLNHPNQTSVNTDVTSPAFGFSSFSGNRTVEIAASVRF